jgi:hypothetical protein
VVAFHRPAYDVGGRFASEQSLFRDATALFDRRVDLVLMGHEHIYQRFEPLVYDAELAQSGEYGRQAGQGVPYLVLPAAGNNGLFNQVIPESDPDGALRQVLVQPALETGQVHVEPWQGFAELRVGPSSLEVLTFEVGDEVEVRDGFVVERSTGGR